MTDGSERADLPRHGDRQCRDYPGLPADCCSPSSPPDSAKTRPSSARDCPWDTDYLRHAWRLCASRLALEDALRGRPEVTRAFPAGAYWRIRTSPVIDELDARERRWRMEV